MVQPWPVTPLGEVAKLNVRSVAPEPSLSYRLVGVKWWGQGVYHYDTVDGAEICAAILHQMRRDDIVINKIWARNGSVAVVPHDLDGAFGSTEFPTYEANRERLEPRWIHWLSRSPFLWAQCNKVSRGTSGKNRMKPHEFLKISLPLPSLEKQRSIVARLDRVERLVKEVHAGKARVSAGTHALTSSLHLSFSPAAEQPLGAFLEIDEDRVPTEAGVAYPQVGVRGFAGGLFKKDAVTGAETSYKHFNRLSEGLFLVSQPKGWEGAVAVCGAEYEGWFSSPEYRTFRCIPGKLHPGYLSALLPTPWFQAALAKLTRGQGARRERLRPDMLLAMPIRMPPWERQLEAIKILERTKEIGAAEAAFTANVDALLPAMLHEIFGDGEA